ncbi:primosomal protein N' [Saliterribacillus persicus]|uniref:Replication restart protein PriA n=1 Tax=Saliterribacillus persicus TaxID=930114 RepID=A0A368XSB7_9BACI|nr:primosomal protein N' [Saliterribacillus persicus]RCW70765.1 replication restart DNA helicase PriA [Saliterribacillus persicus]
MKIAEIIVDVPTRQTNKTFDYKIPETLEAVIKPGIRVIIPFGPRKVMGFVVGIKEETAITNSALKKISEAMDVFPVLTDELLDLGKWIAEETISFYIITFQAMLPQALKVKYHKQIELLTDNKEELPSSIAAIMADRDLIDFDEFQQRNGNYSQLLKAAQEGLLEISYMVKSKATKKTILYLTPIKEIQAFDEALQDIPLQAKKQRIIVEHFLYNPESIPQKELLEKFQTTAGSINPLIKLGLIKKEYKEVYRDPFKNKDLERTYALPLAVQQQEAINPILKAIQKVQHEVFLLHGVTGSGKTEVYLQAIEQVLNNGKEAIVLVPEIALTPQMVNRFKGRFGKKVAVLHSALSKGEKFDEWRKIQQKKVQVVVGARSAIFAPFENLGIIIIDEEHETTYKQDEQPRYDAKEVAKYRARYHNCPVVLGSATPTLETFARAKKGVYHLLELPHRMNEGPMPAVEIVDMRNELHRGNRTMFSEKLMEEIKIRIARQEQIVLFLNRRGYSTFVMCRDCGHVMNCPHCDIALTYHKSSHLLKCHYCAYETGMPATCEECESDTIRFFGTGTQKVEESIQQLIPEARVIRMDVDTTRKKGAHETLLKKFGGHEADILLGTQMIAKGLDFKNVTLVGVLAADAMLHFADFRASEKTFQLLTQVSGRAGRHELPGEVVIQTYTPEHYSIEMASKYQYNQFFAHEMKVRKTFHYPPYYFLTLITISHQNQIRVMEVGKMIRQLLTKHLSERATVLGPTPSPLVRINDRYRYQCMVKYRDEPNLKEIIRKILTHYHDEMKKNDLSIQVDFEPNHLM